MNNTELIIAIICLALGLLARPWRFKENRNNEGKLSFVAVLGWALIIVGGLLLLSAVNKNTGLSVATVLARSVMMVVLVWFAQLLYLFAQKFTYKQIVITGWVTIGSIALLLSSYNGHYKKNLIQLLTVIGVVWIALFLFSRKK